MVLLEAQIYAINFYIYNYKDVVDKDKDKVLFEK